MHIICSAFRESCYGYVLPRLIMILEWCQDFISSVLRKLEVHVYNLWKKTV